MNGSHGNDANDGLSWKTAKRTIANAIETVSDGGTVNIANGVYKGAGNTNIIINKNITIKGQSKSSTIINGTNRDQIFEIENSFSKKVIIQSLTITNGNSDGTAGAIYNGGTLTVKDVIFKDNTANYGGAIYNKGNLNIIRSTFTTNTAKINGGAVYNEGDLTVTSSAFTCNIISSGSNTITLAHDIYNAGTLTAHFNQLEDYTYYYTSVNIPASATRTRTIYNDGGTVDAELNWWGNNNGPAKNVTKTGFTVSKWLVLTANTNSTTIPVNTNYKINADLRYDNNGILHTEGYVYGIPIIFSTTFGTIGSKAYTVNGIAQFTLKSTSGGTGNVSIKLDAQQFLKEVKIIDKVPPKVSSTNPKNNAAGFSRTATISIKFNENIKASTYWSKIYIKNMKTGKTAVISKSIKGNTLYIKMSSKRYAYTWYQVYIPKAAVKDSSNNKLAAVYTFKFKTGKYPLDYQ